RAPTHSRSSPSRPTPAGINGSIMGISARKCAVALPDLPRRTAAIEEVSELLLLLEGVHAPEPIVPVPEELPLPDEPGEWLDNEFLARLDVIEYLPAHNEVPAIDKEAGVADRAHTVDVTLRAHVDEVEALRWWHCDEGRDLVGCGKRVDHLGQVGVRQAVRVVGKEHLIVLNVLTDRDEPLTDVRMQAGIDEGDVPVFDVVVLEFEMLAAL